MHRSSPKIISDPKKNQVDDETLGALLGNRFQVLDQYWRKVVRPVLREQKQRATKPQQGLLRGARRLLTKDEAQINPAEQAQLQEILATGPSLKTIYDLRNQLQEVWHRTTASQVEMLERLQQWCQVAEASGIQVLQDFVALMKTYTLKQQPVRVKSNENRF